MAFTLEPREVTTNGGEVFEIWVPRFDAATVDVDVNEVVNSDVKNQGGQAGPKVGHWRNGFSITSGKRERRCGLATFTTRRAMPDSSANTDPQEDGKLRWSAG